MKRLQPYMPSVALIMPLLFVLSLVATIVIVSMTGSQPVSQVAGDYTEVENLGVSQSPLPEIAADSEAVHILLVGHGGPGHPGGSLADLILLLHLDPVMKKIGLIGIPRDLVVNQTGVTSKINATFSRSPEALMEAVATVTGLRPTEFIAVDFVGIQRAIHALGGVRVIVSTPLRDEWYPIAEKALDPCGKSDDEIALLTNTLSGFELEKQFPCRYETIEYDAGEMVMEGADVLKYVRSRHSSSDFARTQRAQAVLKAIWEKVIDPEYLTAPVDALNAFLPFVTTSLTGDAAASLAAILPLFLDQPVVYVNLTTENVLKPASLPNLGSTLLSSSDSYDSVHAYVASRLSE